MDVEVLYTQHQTSSSVQHPAKDWDGAAAPPASTLAGSWNTSRGSQKSALSFDGFVAALRQLAEKMSVRPLPPRAPRARLRQVALPFQRLLTALRADTGANP